MTFTHLGGSASLAGVLSLISLSFRAFDYDGAAGT